MITNISISLSWVEPPTHRNLPIGVHHISELIPHVLDRYGLSLELDRNPDSERPVPLRDPIDVFDVMIACLEEALAT